MKKSFRHRLTRRATPLLILAVVLTGMTAAPSRQVIAISADAGGAGGNDVSHDPNISGDGRQVVFRSEADNLVPDDTNGVEDIFLKSADAGGIDRVSTASDGAQANGASQDAAISPDGEFIVFATRASNLVSGTQGGVSHIVRKDVATGEVRLVSSDAAGVAGNADSVDPAISQDGRYIAFASEASNLVPGDANGLLDIYLKDMDSGGIARVSTSAAGAEGNGTSGDLYGPSISADGRKIVFSSQSTNLAPGDTDTVHDIFIKNMDGDAIRIVSTSDTDAKGNGNSLAPGISADGDAVVFRSQSTNLSAADTEPGSDAYHKDLTSGKLTLVSSDGNGVKANDQSFDPAISPDGKYAAFSSDATNLVAGVTEPVYYIYLRDIRSGAMTLVSADAAGTPGDGDSTTPSLSRSAKRVAFESTSVNLVGGMSGNYFKVFLAITGDEPVAGGCALKD